MSLREVCWGVYLVGLPFAHFLLWTKGLNQYHLQNFWAYGGLTLLLGLSLVDGESRPLRNWPLACWLLWTTWSLLWMWKRMMVTNQLHPVGLLPFWIHATSVVWFYLAAVRTWTAELLTRVLRWVAFAGIGLVAYGYLQLAGLDQFYRSTDFSLQGDVLVGTIGNPTHYGLHLALFLSVWLWQPEWWWKLVAVAASILLPLTLSTSAMLCGMVAWLWWSWHEARVVAWGILGLSLLGFGWLVWHDRLWLDPEGRYAWWTFLWQHYLVGQNKAQITGAGLGRMMLDSLQAVPGWWPSWRHAHNEFFQVLIETGVVGLGIVLWGLGERVRCWWALPGTPLAFMLAGIGLVFVLSSLVNFSAHLWLLGVFGLLAYCGIEVLSAEGNTA